MYGQLKDGGSPEAVPPPVEAAVPFTSEAAVGAWELLGRRHHPASVLARACVP